MSTISTNNTPALEIKGLQAWYGESHILHGVDLTVNRGEVVTLLGRNGCESRSSPGSYCAKPLDSVCCEGFLLFAASSLSAVYRLA